MSTIYQTKAEGLAVKQEILNQVVSGIKGVATQTNAPTTYTAEAYPNGLFETYVVRTPLTMPNSWGSAVTQAEINSFSVYFDVTDGVVNKILEPIKGAYTSYLSTTTDSPVKTEAQWVSSIGVDLLSVRKVLGDYLVETYDTFETVTFNNSISSLGSLKSDGTITSEGSDLYNKFIVISAKGIKNIKIHSRPFNSSNYLYAMMVGVKSDGSAESLLPCKGGTEYEDFEVNVVVGKFSTFKICYSYFNGPDNDFLVTVLKGVGQGNIVQNAVKKDFNPINKILKTFVLGKTTETGEVTYTREIATPGTLRTDGTIANEGVDIDNRIVRFDLEGVSEVKIRARPFGANNTIIYSMFVGIRENGATVQLLPPIPGSPDYQDFTVPVSGFVSGIFCYCLSCGSDDQFYVKVVTGIGPRIIEENAVKKYIDQKTGDSFNPYQKELLRYFDKPKSIGRMEIEGELPTNPDKTKVDVNFKLYSNNTLLLKSKAKMALQGSSSVTLYLKKNYSIDIVNEENKAVEVKIGDWEVFSKFHLKAYATDLTMARDIGSAKLWHKMRTNRPYPSSLISKPGVIGINDQDKMNSYEGALFYTDGFPIEVYSYGTFLGLYVWRLKKDSKNYRLDNSLDTNILLANANVDNLIWTAFNYNQWEVVSPKMTGYDENLPIPNTTVSNSINRLWTWFDGVRSGSVNFESTVDSYINTDSFVDYIILSQMINHWDNWENNMMLITWDGLVWSLVPYDMDFSMGKTSPYWAFTDNPAQLVWRGTFWRDVMYAKLLTRIKTRWSDMRTKGFMTPKLYEECYKPFFTAIGRENYIRENAKWEFVGENTGHDNLNYFLSFAENKISYLDGIWRI